MEDRTRIASRENVHFFGVFDGHGGCQAADFARDGLWELLDANPLLRSTDPADVERAIRQAFIDTHHAMAEVRDPLLPVRRPSTRFILQCS